MGRSCENCGAPLGETAGFCSRCGAKNGSRKAGPERAAPPAPRGLVPDATGKYHWYYELNMFTEPTVFITCWKVFTLVVGIMSVIMFFILLGDGLAEAALFFLKFFAYGIGGMTVLLALGYSVYALIMGGKYCVVFEMDDKKVSHTQLAKQFKRMQVVAGLAALAGASRGSLSMVGTGLLAGSRNSMATTFKDVDRIKVARRRRVIYLHSGLGNNQVYAQRESFDAVLEYILARIPAGAKRRGIT